MVESIEDFKSYLASAALAPAELGKLNTLIFHEWNAAEAKKQLPEDVISFIAANQHNESVRDEIYHALLPQDLRSE